MSDDLLRTLALKAGVQPVWRNQRGEPVEVAPDVLRAVLAAFSLPCANEDDIRNSISALEIGAGHGVSAPFITGRVDLPVVIPVAAPEDALIEVEYENGSVHTVKAQPGIEGALTLPPFTVAGYHTVRVGNQSFTVATAPARCVTTTDRTGGEKCWGVAAQIYSLRRPGDGGIGDFGSAAALARAIAARGGDFLALSPVHALFAAEPRHFSPYSPSSRLFYNPLHADPEAAFPAPLLREIIVQLGIGDAMAQLEGATLIDWPASSALRYKLLHALHAHLRSDASNGQAYRLDFDRFRTEMPALLRDHAAFETIHAQQLAQGKPWSWQEWDAPLRNPHGPEVAALLAAHGEEMDFHVFLQWIAGRSYAECQRVSREAGMRIGLIADMAIGMEGTGSHAWSRQDEVISGLSIGAPPDYYNVHGQNWGLTGFSPRGLAASRYAPFIDTLRASMRFSGGIRIDHVMGLRRLWLIPRGGRGSDGAYVEYPSETLFRLVALESSRHQAVVFGEDLGVVPEGFRDDLRGQGVAGLRVLRFEGDRHGFFDPADWDAGAAALTTTHDLVSTAGWWAGSDLSSDDHEGGDQSRQSIRAWNRGLLWSAFEKAGVAQGARPTPEEPDAVVDAAVAFIARTPCAVRLLAIEDALGLPVQPNVPGTTDEKPNWRHRLPGDASALLDSEAAMRRLKMLGAHEPDDHGMSTPADAAP